MNCIEFRTAIAGAVERRRRPESAVASHLAECSDPACRACWDEAAVVDRAIVQWRQSAAAREPDLADAVVGVLVTDARVLPMVASPVRGCGSGMVPGGTRVAAGRDSGTVWRVAAVAVVAAVLVVLIVDRPVARARREAAVADRGMAGDAGLAYVVYAQDAAQIVTDAVVLTLGDSSEMEAPRIGPLRIGWEGTWASIGEGMDAALEGLLEGAAAEAPHS